MNTIWYHLAPKNADTHNGILSPYYMATHDMEDVALDSLDKYRDRMVNSWNIYPNKNPKKLTLEELLEGLNQFRGEYGSRAIYLFKYPPVEQMGKNMAKVLKYKDLYEVDISKIPNFLYIDYHVNNGPTEDWYNTVDPVEYFSSYDDNAEAHGKLLFAGIPHVALITRDGRIPPYAIQQLVRTVMYHGSNEKHSILIPQISKAYPDKKVVYATPYFSSALVFAGKPWNDLMINQCFVDNQQILTEILPGMFEKCFNTKGYVHFISADGFYPLRKDSDREYISPWPIKPHKIKTIPNVMKELEQHSIRMLKFPQLPKHIPDRKRYIYEICKKWNLNPQKYFDMTNE